MSRMLKGAKTKNIFKRKLRNEMTGPEKRLWWKLRNKQFFGLKFRRQHGIGEYIVDFYCPEKMLVIEIDGDTHYENKGIRHDIKRDLLLITLGNRIVRYTNREIMTELEGVLEDLRSKIMK